MMHGGIAAFGRETPASVGGIFDMMSMLFSLALAAASANTAENDTRATTAPAAKPAKPKKICEKIESTGSAVPKRVCRTVVETVKPKEEATQTVADKPSAGATN
ncbi:hypothetical protein ATE67_03655 [Sphingopyxis sp. H050]|jgi:hypothetical protein|nr:hypothetical protein ATE67_03655 [Sphingopyxis sp. H050]